MSSFQFVDNAADFAALMERLAAYREWALDTEFMRERTYYPRLCLIQVAVPQAEFAIDPLALDDLSPFANLLSDPAIRIVLHAARQDVEVLLTRCPLQPANLFDTQVAAALCGHPPQIGYGELVHKTLDVCLDKAHSRTDWTQRPLSDEQLRYAAEDVRYLPPLRAQLQSGLEALGRLPWFEEEMKRMADPALYRTEPADAWQRLKGLDTTDERRIAAAQALAQWREQRAMDRDRPRGWILPDDALHEIIRVLPEDLSALNSLRLVPKGVIQRCGAEIVAAIASTRHLPANAARQRYAPPDPQQQKLLKSLIEKVKFVAKELNLSPEVLATRRDLEALVMGRTDVPTLKTWRRGVIGDLLLSQL